MQQTTAENQENCVEGTCRSGSVNATESEEHNENNINGKPNHYKILTACYVIMPVDDILKHVAEIYLYFDQNRIVFINEIIVKLFYFVFSAEKFDHNTYCGVTLSDHKYCISTKRNPKYIFFSIINMRDFKANSMLM